MQFESRWTPINTLAGDQPQLLKCPFCDKEESKPNVWRKKAKSAANGYHFYVKCLSCDCLGPRSLDLNNSVRLWNTRSAWN